MSTERQEMWQRASEQEAAHGNPLLAGFFSLLALPNANEREHACLEHSMGFSRNGRRGFQCGICKSILKWVDPEPGIPADIRALYDELDRTTDPHERAAIEQSLANREA